MLFPDVSHEPVIRNPFPQLSRVAVAPFFNQSDEPTVDGRKFALAYFAELQATPGFEVVPLGVVEEAILEHQVDLSSAGEARKLAQILGVDVVVIGSVTDYTPYYPPRCGLRVEWYALNPGFHEIPPGYGLPWGTPEQEFIPDNLVFEAEFAVAKAQLATQTPHCEVPPLDPPPKSPPPAPLPYLPVPNGPNAAPGVNQDPGSQEDWQSHPTATNNGRRIDNRASASVAAYEQTAPEEELPLHDSGSDSSLRLMQPNSPDFIDTTGATSASGALSPGCPGIESLVPGPLCAPRQACMPHQGPIMTHTRIYHGHDGHFTEALANYYHFRKDARFGGWQTYLQRSDDFIRFCCHMHIAEMLSARGGADQTRVVCHWPDCR